MSSLRSCLLLGLIAVATTANALPEGEQARPRWTDESGRNAAYSVFGVTALMRGASAVNDWRQERLAVKKDRDELDSITGADLYPLCIAAVSKDWFERINALPKDGGDTRADSPVVNTEKMHAASKNEMERYRLLAPEKQHLYDQYAVERGVENHARCSFREGAEEVILARRKKDRKAQRDAQHQQKLKNIRPKNVMPSLKKNEGGPWKDAFKTELGEFGKDSASSFRSYMADPPGSGPGARGGQQGSNRGRYVGNGGFKPKMGGAPR